MFKSLVRLGEIYGPVVGFYMGPTQPFISVCGYQAVREVLNNHDFDGRLDTDIIKMRTFGERLGLIFTDGEFWQEQRRFFLRHLRDLGFGRTSSEDVIRDEIYDLIKEVKYQADKSQGVVDFCGMFNLSLLNVLWALIGGERFKHNDAKLQRLLSAVNQFIRSGNPTRSGIPLPMFLLKNISFLRRWVGLKVELFTPVQDFILECIDQHQHDPLNDGSPRDFIDIYLNEMGKSMNEDGKTTFFKNQLIGAIVDLFLAGAETTSNAIGWMILFLIHHPDAQKKLQAELDEVCGDSLPLLVHRPSLFYTEAVLMESQRFSNSVPFTVPHRAMKDTKVLGFSVPKGTIAFLNLYSVHMEKSFWKDPEVFRPERHLSSEGKLIKTDHFMPFGAGRRMCLGESLARNTYFLYATALLKTFEFSPVPGQPLPTLNPIYGLTNSYEGFNAVVTSRQ